MTLRSPRSLGVALAALALALSVGAVPAAAAALGASAPSSATAQTTIDSCTTITESGTYVLTADVDNAGDTAISEPCVEIRADGVTFDGDGHVLEGRGESHTSGVAVVEAEGVEVRNVDTRDWHNGVVVENGSASVSGVHTRGNAYGVRVERADATVSNNTIEDNLVGVYAPGDGDVTVADNDSSGNELATKGVENATATATATAATPDERPA